MTPDITRLFAECDRRQRIEDAKALANIERINAILERSIWREKKPARPAWDAWFFAASATFALVTLAAVFFAPSETAQLLGY